MMPDQLAPRLGSRPEVACRRQVPLGERYIADFVARAVRLVVEGDGGCHRGRSAADARRDRELARLGYRVLQVPAQLVLSQPLEALAQVRTASRRLRALATWLAWNP